MASVKMRAVQKRKRRDLNAPKKPMSGYFLFGKQMRAEDSELSKLPVAEQGKTISEMWKKLGDVEREEYNQRSARERETYMKAVEEYKKSAEYREYLDKMAAEGDKEGKKKPKRVTGYNEFFKQMYETVAKDNPELTMGEITSMVAKKWKGQSESEKAVYNKMAEEKNAHADSVEK